MALLYVSEWLLRFGAFISETSPAFKLVGIVAIIAASSVYLVGSGKEQQLPRWLPLEIGAASYLISSGGVGLSI